MTHVYEIFLHNIHLFFLIIRFCTSLGYFYSSLALHYFSGYLSYILLAKISCTPYFFDCFSLPLSFRLTFIPRIHLWLLNLSWRFQLYRMRINEENYENVSRTLVMVVTEIRYSTFFNDVVRQDFCSLLIHWYVMDRQLKR